MLYLKPDIQPYFAQWKTEISTDAPFGEDITFSEDFDIIRLEVDKTTSIHAEDSTNWKEVFERSSAMLGDTSKDLWLFCYGCKAAFATHGLAGLAEALSITADFVGTHWKEVYPIHTKPGRRAAPFAWFVSQTEHLLTAEDFAATKAEVNEKIKTSLSAMQKILDAELGDNAPSFRSLIRLIPDQAPETAPTPPSNRSRKPSPTDKAQKTSKKQGAAKVADGQAAPDCPELAEGATTGKTAADHHTSRTHGDYDDSGDPDEFRNLGDSGDLSDPDAIGDSKNLGKGDVSDISDLSALSDVSQSKGQDSLTEAGQPSALSPSLSPLSASPSSALSSATSPSMPSPADSIPPSTVPRMSDASLTQLIRNTSDSTRQLAGYFLGLAPTDWKSYLLHRGILWGSILQLPDANEEGLTQVRPPAKERVQEYANALDNGQYGLILNQLEKTAAHAPFWFDGHYMVVQCLQQLRAPMSAKIIESSLHCFLSKFSQLITYRFFDKTPFASEGTKEWINGFSQPENAASSLFLSSSETSETQHNALLASAFELMGKKGFREAFHSFDAMPLTKSRQGVLNALLKIRFCLLAGRPQAALSLATITYKQLEEWGVVEWEPELSAQLLALIIQSKTLPEEKRAELTQRLHWLHMETALALGIE